MQCFLVKWEKRTEILEVKSDITVSALQTIIIQKFDLDHSSCKLFGLPKVKNRSRKRVKLTSKSQECTDELSLTAPPGSSERLNENEITLSQLKLSKKHKIMVVGTAKECVQQVVMQEKEKVKEAPLLEENYEDIIRAQHHEFSLYCTRKVRSQRER